MNQNHLENLMAGNQRFASGEPRCSLTTAHRAELASGQAPYATILSCSDSRVPVEVIFDHEAGNIFVTRVVGNFVNDDILGSLEYAVSVLHSKLIMVMGHTSCEAVRAAIEVVGGATFPGHIQGLAESIVPAVLAAKSHEGDLHLNAVIENVRVNVVALSDRSQILREAQQVGAVKVVGAIYDLRSGSVTVLD